MEKTELRKHAHPMPGWVVVYPIPDPDEREGARTGPRRSNCQASGVFSSTKSR